MEISEKSLEQIKKTIQEATSRYAFEVESPIVTDFQVYVDQESGEFIISNDDDEQLGQCIIKECMDYEGEEFFEEIQTSLRMLFAEMNANKNFDSLIVFRPYSFILVDAEGETISDLLLIDDDTLVLTEGLLTGLDEELNDFLTHLLED
jgi:hypothetical protein